jgi:hypothetical protein
MTEIYDSKTALSVTQAAQQVLISMLRKSLPNLMAHSIAGVQPMGNTGDFFSYKNDWLFQGHNKTYWPYQHTPSGLIPILDMERWCWENISHGRYWRNYGNKFAFKRKEDAMLFVLRWP